MERIYRGILFIIGVVGVVWHILSGGMRMLMYYTVLSNIITVLFLAYLMTQRTQNDETLRLKAGVTVMITLTFVVYHFLLSPTVSAEDFYEIDNLICHYILPLGFLADTLWFDHVNYRNYDPILWGGFPLAYFVFILVNVWFLKIPIPGSAGPSLDSVYPYFFMDAEKYGWTSVLQYSFAIFVVYITAGYVLFLIKATIANRRYKKCE